MILLKGCRLIPALTEDYDSQRADVLIRKNRIEAIKPEGFDFGSLETACVLELNGMTLMPGLFELHTHLCFYVYNSWEIQCADPGFAQFQGYAFAKEYLNQGYTTVRDCGSTHNMAVNIRRAIDGGILPGPRIITGGLIITPTETGNETFGNLYSEADGPDELRKAVRIELQKGNDFIKYMASGAYMNEGGDPGARIATDEELTAVVEAASLKNTYVAAHAHGTESIKAALRAGVRTIEHGTFIDEEGIALLQNSKRAYMVPTAGIGLYCLDESNTQVSSELLEKSLLYLEQEKACVNGAFRAGLRLGFGSDLDMEAIRDNPGIEFYARKEYFSFSDLEIVKQATLYSAEIAGLDHLVGTVKQGKLADLIVVDGNPDEDIYVMKKPVRHVIRDGVLIK